MKAPCCTVHCGRSKNRCHPKHSTSASDVGEFNWNRLWARNCNWFGDVEELSKMALIFDAWSKLLFRRFLLCPPKMDSSWAIPDWTYALQNRSRLVLRRTHSAVQEPRGDEDLRITLRQHPPHLLSQPVSPSPSLHASRFDFRFLLRKWMSQSWKQEIGRMA